jgi:hypothetical protein
LRAEGLAVPPGEEFQEELFHGEEARSALASDATAVEESLEPPARGFVFIARQSGRFRSFTVQLRSPNLVSGADLTFA